MSDPYPPPAELGLELRERLTVLEAELGALARAQEARLRAIPYEDRRASEEAERWLDSLRRAERAAYDLLEHGAADAYAEVAAVHPDGLPPSLRLEVAAEALCKARGWRTPPALRPAGPLTVLAADASDWGPPELAVYRTDDLLEAHRREVEREHALGRPLTRLEALDHWSHLSEHERQR